MRTFYDYKSYAAWRDEGNGPEIPVKLVGSGVGTWVATYEAQAEIARLTAERDALREAYDDLKMEVESLRLTSQRRAALQRKEGNE